MSEFSNNNRPARSAAASTDAPCATPAASPAYTNRYNHAERGFRDGLGRRLPVLPPLGRVFD